MLSLKIVSPERVEFTGEVESVTVPGTNGEFEILVNHAPIISSLSAGTVAYVNKDGRHTLAVSGGFAEVQKNNVSVCVELERGA